MDLGMITNADMPSSHSFLLTHPMLRNMGHDTSTCGSALYSPPYLATNHACKAGWNVCALTAPSPTYDGGCIETYFIDTANTSGSPHRRARCHTGGHNIASAPHDLLLHTLSQKGPGKYVSLPGRGGIGRRSSNPTGGQLHMQHTVRVEALRYLVVHCLPLALDLTRLSRIYFYNPDSSYKNKRYPQTVIEDQIPQNHVSAAISVLLDDEQEEDPLDVPIPTSRVRFTQQEDTALTSMARHSQPEAGPLSRLPESEEHAEAVFLAQLHLESYHVPCFHSPSTVVRTHHLLHASHHALQLLLLLLVAMSGSILSRV
ncbi:hypothetical protein AZE42_03926 [Rhizopogon vesiculosus]|uniref:Uncharacterized protein n=1 Tax=Rhizopogon vesiculosus TaxID=180088 RepID=A0A1J8PUN4_9AGAM|nr:hypothetical protein AZE42_03926 [Rhizopogon vesiculosus]